MEIGIGYVGGDHTNQYVVHHEEHFKSFLPLFHEKVAIYNKDC